MLRVVKMLMMRLVGMARVHGVGHQGVVVCMRSTSFISVAVASLSD